MNSIEVIRKSGDEGPVLLHATRQSAQIAINIVLYLITPSCMNVIYRYSGIYILFLVWILERSE